MHYWEQGYVNVRLHYQDYKLKVSTKREWEKEFRPCFEMVADLNFPGYLMLAGSAGQDVPDSHIVRSVKVFDPSGNEKESIYDYEAERDTVDYIRITEGTPAHFDIIHEKAPVESLSNDELFNSINGFLWGMKQKFQYLNVNVDLHISKAKKLYADLPKWNHIIPTLEAA